MSILVLLPLLCQLLTSGAQAFFFSLDKEECVYHSVTNATYIYTAFVVTKFDHYWVHEDEKFAVDLKVTDPIGHAVYHGEMKTEDKFFYYASDPGSYKYCFTNRGRIHVQMSMEIMTNEQHMNQDKEHLKDHHVDPVHTAMNQLNYELQQAHHDIWYAFYIASQHINLDKALGRKLLWKGALQAVLLVACCITQIFVLRWLVEKRLRTSRV